MPEADAAFPRGGRRFALRRRSCLCFLEAAVLEEEHNWSAARFTRLLLACFVFAFSHPKPADLVSRRIKTERILSGIFCLFKNNSRVIPPELGTFFPAALRNHQRFATNRCSSLFSFPRNFQSESHICSKACLSPLIAIRHGCN